MKMYQLIEWFQINFPKMHNDLLLCNHNFDDKDLNPYHLESDCWSHTMMVCKIAELSNYDKVVQIAALLHDIGKPASRKINPKNNHVQFFGHEIVSAELAEDILNMMVGEIIIDAAQKQEILKLIKHHAFLYKHPEPNVLMRYFSGNKLFCRHLVELIRCDSLGRFSPDMGNEEKFEQLLVEIEIYEKFNTEITYMNIDDGLIRYDEISIKKLWEWADENNISDEDLPRDTYRLLSMDCLNLYVEEEDGYILNSIPKEIGILSNLTELLLTIDADKCETIPNEIGNLESLTLLSMDVYSLNNSELVLPLGIAKLTGLREVYLSGNIPTESIGLLLEHCKGMKLSIDNNGILKVLPKNLCQSDLSELVLMNNKNLLLSPKQFEWALNLRDDEKGYEKVYCFDRGDGTCGCYTTDYGQKFKYHSIIPFDISENIPEPDFPTETKLLEVEW